jgi:hypothetical protein
MSRPAIIASGYQNATEWRISVAAPACAPCSMAEAWIPRWVSAPPTDCHGDPLRRDRSAHPVVSAEDEEMHREELPTRTTAMVRSCFLL